jgi:hypothetical protein
MRPLPHEMLQGVTEEWGQRNGDKPFPFPCPHSFVCSPPPPLVGQSGRANAKPLSTGIRIQGQFGME